MKKTGFGWGEFVTGLLLVLLGIFTLVSPESMFTGMVVVYGIIAAVIGVCDIVLYVRLERFTGFGPMVSLVSGILSVMCGVMLIANPNVGKWAVMIMLPVWLIAHCISGIAHTGAVRMMTNSFCYYFAMMLNILGLILGIFMLVSPALSFLTARTIAYIAAFYLIVFGIESIAAAFVRRHFYR